MEKSYNCSIDKNKWPVIHSIFEITKKLFFSIKKLTKKQNFFNNKPGNFFTNDEFYFSTEFK